jgi:hypothetical protein
MKALITTTINVPRNLFTWRKMMKPDDVIIVAGDINSPHQEIVDYLVDLEGGISKNRYLHPHDQTRYRCSGSIGWRSIQRRNIALLEAMQLRPRYITVVDDDNYPISREYFDQVEKLLFDPKGHEVIVTDTGWFDIGTLFQPQFVVRGFPYTLRHTKSLVASHISYNRIGVVASYWLGDPDCDAISRIHAKPDVKNTIANVVLGAPTMCPFNSQATSYRGDLAPLMCVWPDVGRYDDIWGSYLAQRVMHHLGFEVYFGKPYVNQIRNEHDLLHDLREELYGLEHTEELIAALKSVEFKDGKRSIIEFFEQCAGALEEILPENTMLFLDDWAHDVSEALL